MDQIKRSEVVKLYFFTRPLLEDVNTLQPLAVNSPLAQYWNHFKSVVCITHLEPKWWENRVQVERSQSYPWTKETAKALENCQGNPMLAFQHQTIPLSPSLSPLNCIALLIMSPVNIEAGAFNISYYPPGYSWQLPAEKMLLLYHLSVREYLACDHSFFLLVLLRIKGVFLWLFFGFEPACFWVLFDVFFVMKEQCGRKRQVMPVHWTNADVWAVSLAINEQRRVEGRRED